MASGRRSVGGYKAAATRASRDAEVSANVSPALRPLWNRVRRGFKGSMEARTRAFQQYVHDHPKEVGEALNRHAEGKLKTLLSTPRKSVPGFVKRVLSGRGAGNPRASASSGSAGTQGRYGIQVAGVPF